MAYYYQNKPKTRHKCFVLTSKKIYYCKMEMEK